jgi:hypothetical protein
MRQWLGRWWRWVTATRARRSALTLAVLAAIASPFATDSYDAEQSYLPYDEPPTIEQRALYWGGDIRYCKTPDCGWSLEIKRRSRSYYYWLTPPEMAEASAFWNWGEDIRYEKAIDSEAEARPEYRFSLSRYVAANSAVMLVTLVVTFFALTAAMAVVRSWWRWWW